jgi:phosphate-selective porin OprO/OprP
VKFLTITLFAASLAAMAQGPDSTHAGGTDPNLPQPTSKANALSGNEALTSEDSQAVKERQFSTPDVPHKLTDFTSYNGDYFSIRFGFAGLVDYTAFWQDTDSKTQVGTQRDQWDTRSARFSLSGGVGPETYKVHYLLSYEFKGFDAPPDATWSWTDLSISLPAGKLGAVTVGYTKEPFVYEMVGDAAFLPQMERILSPFFVSRDVGVVLNNTALNKRMTYRAGWYNDWWTKGRSYDTSGNHFVGRVTGLVSVNEDSSRYLHLGVAARYAGANDGVIRMRGRPESNVASYYVDTGDIPASNQKEMSLEGLWTRDGYSVNAEYVRSWVNAAQVENPSFYGFYITGSWIITGEHRPYDRNVGFARRVIPQRHFGAVEIVARYSHLDLNDKSIHGGILDKGLLGVNWFMNRRWKIGVAGGLANLDRSSLHGLTEMLQAACNSYTDSVVEGNA